MSCVHHTPDACISAYLDHLHPWQQNTRLRDGVNDRDDLPILSEIALFLFEFVDMLPKVGEDRFGGGRELEGEGRHLRMRRNVSQILDGLRDGVISCRS